MEFVEAVGKVYYLQTHIIQFLLYILIFYRIITIKRYIYII